MTAIPDVPGIYEGLSYEQYDAIKAWRRTTIEEGRRSLEHLLWARDHSKPPTEALEFGKMMHMAMFEPDRFEATVVLGRINEKTNEPYGWDTVKQDEFRAANPGKIVVTKGFRDSIVGIGNRVRSHPNAWPLMRSSERTELVMVWTHEATGELVKARLDSVGKIAIVDLKTTEDASPETFCHAIYRYGYHRQAAMYLDGWRALTGQKIDYVVVAVEKTPPYGLSMFTACDADEAVQIGRAEYTAVLYEIANARKTGNWTGYPVEVQSMTVPAWVRAKFTTAE